MYLGFTRIIMWNLILFIKKCKVWDEKGDTNSNLKVHLLQKIRILKIVSF